eukprot:CAMPEP_0175067428 /NCGR_PEP_ID=MMETSP0052_2-20121109/17095_1 /TAXON_ID=51329 ORGANISM="Polytomella parva, Strain SAG 63-3" /NCGR_SAMPLE_ID=MMETSP0052_2 /ASSEMBLY_ACC=CAM_ASM_000194 /LENGTH=98 /DNA_ID=CAMNT_0016334313 /DNA_START=37 /DNA_END=329 /DNA_ORIENTATION=-
MVGPGEISLAALIRSFERGAMEGGGTDEKGQVSNEKQNAPNIMQIGRTLFRLGEVGQLVDLTRFVQTDFRLLEKDRSSEEGRGDWQVQSLVTMEWLRG